ncbi:MAG: hypothetical protein JXR46_11800 [Calditrichaceae bacterium]|nr:hypothetical protein [Calditrichaceae bacterium]MBN2709718.1 hypothetical protein [Calditrichaceae bacterium]RQV92537.1 MAG: hypothetical protein EH224_15185 [Calditrichota bacterium]
MRNLPLIMFGIITMLVLSCSSVKYVKSSDDPDETLREFNYLARHRTGYIVLNSGEIIETYLIKLQKDSLEYIEQDESSYKTIHSNEIKLIYFKDRFSSAMQGALAGAIGTGLISLAVIDRDADMAGLAVAYAMAGGTVVGAATGGLIGNKVKYIILPDEK